MDPAIRSSLRTENSKAVGDSSTQSTTYASKAAGNTQWKMVERRGKQAKQKAVSNKPSATQPK